MIDHVQFITLRCHQRDSIFESTAGTFCYGHDIVLADHFTIHFLEIMVKVWAHTIVFDDISFVSFRKFRPGSILGNKLECVHSKAIDALFQPEFHDVINFLPYLGIFPFKIRLLLGKVVQVIGVSEAIVLPGVVIDIKEAEPWWRFSIFCGPPMVIVSVGVIARASGLLEPMVLIAAVVYYQIHDQTDTPVVHTLQHFIKILHGAEFRHDCPVIANIIAHICIGGFINRIKPNSINAQALQVIQFRDDAPQVSYPISVAVFKTAGIYLVNHNFFPPNLFFL